MLSYRLGARRERLSPAPEGEAAALGLENNRVRFRERERWSIPRCRDARRVFLTPNRKRRCWCGKQPVSASHTLRLAKRFGFNHYRKKKNQWTPSRRSSSAAALPRKFDPTIMGDYASRTLNHPRLPATRGTPAGLPWSPYIYSSMDLLPDRPCGARIQAGRVLLPLSRQQNGAEP